MIALVALFACSGAVPAEFAICELQITPNPAEAFPGEPVDVVGGPTSVTFDTVVTVGGVAAQVLDITREGCDFCDVCRADNNCLSCAGTCIACEELCAADCVETTTLVVPDGVGYGETDIAIVNTFGTGTAPFLVLGAPPEPTGDTGSTEPTGEPPTPDTSSVDSSDTSMTGDTGP